MFQSSASAFGDPNAYRAIFFEETQEHLANVEAILLRLQADQPSYADDLNAIFRAVHSIKGSAAMLGCEDMAALTHLQENLLDLLRKHERPLEPGDVDALLKAGDTVHAQALRHRGVLPTAPDAAPAESLLRQQLARPRTDAPGAGAGPVRRRFAVQVAPLEAPIDDAELAMMLEGLAEVGEVAGTEVDNVAGGSICFEVALEGTAADLHSVLSLLVAPELIAIEQRALNGTAATAATVPHVGAHPADEFFVDPEELRQRRRAVAAAIADADAGASAGGLASAAAPSATEVNGAADTDDAFEAFLDPAALRAFRQRAEVAASPPAAAPTPVTAAEPSPALPAEGPATAPVADLYEPFAAPAAEAAYIRVATEKIDLLVNLVGELVITEAMLTRSGQLETTAGTANRFVEHGLADLSRHTRNLQEAVLAIRMLPIANVFSRFPRLVHELSARLGKRVELKFSGEATELDRGLIEKISDPLTHLVRNAIDHGIEAPDVREAAGKPPVGLVRLKASQRGGNIVIEVRDDGRGLDRERILARAAQRGMALPADADDDEVWQLIFEAGFSTADQVTEVSGRGVGMDVVRRNIHSLGGTIGLDARPGEGTVVTVSVPLTLAIMDAMTIAIGGETYVLPLATVVESLSIEAGQMHTLPGQGDTLRVRDDYLPVIHLARIFPPQRGVGEPGAIAVIVEADGTHAALVVDELVGQQQIVVKSLEANFRKVPGLAGATVMGDGSVALILDVSHIVRLTGRHAAMLM